MSIVINGTTGISGVDGSAGTPALQGTDADTGIFYGTNTVSIATNGVAAISVDASQSTTFSAQTLFPDGSVSAPSISNTGDTNCGIYFPAADTVSVATSGTQAIQVNSTQQLEVSDGTVSLPSLTNIGDTNTGVYFPSADNVAIATGGVAALTADSSQNVSVTNTLAMGSSFLRNKIINGAMVIDQRNAGASVTPTDGQYTLDRWKLDVSQTTKLTVQQNAGSVTPPSGFTSYLGVTSSSSYSVGSTDYFALRQIIEGFNSSDLDFGNSNAKSITLSFWVRSSLTGTFGGSLRNSAGNRSYPYSYVISSANTWEYKTVTIAGDTTGTWLTNNGVGINVWFGLGIGSTFSGTAGSWNSNNNLSATGATSVVGTNGATFYITGVQLEVGSIATPFERRQYGTELMLCQRYYYRATSSGTSFSMFAPSWSESTTVATGQIRFPVTMRTRPTSLEQSGTAANYAVLTGATSVTCSAVPVYVAYTNPDVGCCSFTVASGLTAGQGTALASANGVAAAYLGWSAEL